MIFRFFIALLLAATWQCWVMVKEFWGQGKGILVALWQLTKGDEVPKELQAERLAECRKCPLFHQGLRTCGSPLMWRTWPKLAGKRQPMGCLCFMEFKVKTKDNCFLYDQTLGTMGWPEKLNSFPIKNEPERISQD